MISKSFGAFPSREAVVRDNLVLVRDKKNPFRKKQLGFYGVAYVFELWP